MKTLYLMRHAKSSWKDPSLADHQRPLNPRGEKAAPRMGKRLKKKGVELDVIFSSDAKRAMQTAAAMADVLGLPPNDIRPDPKLYNAEPDAIFKAVNQFDDQWENVMVVAHNPRITDLANRFYSEPIANIPTAGMVELRFDAPSWRKIDRNNLWFATVDFPKRKPKK